MAPVRASPGLDKAVIAKLDQHRFEQLERNRSVPRDCRRGRPLLGGRPANAMAARFAYFALLESILPPMSFLSDVRAPTARFLPRRLYKTLDANYMDYTAKGGIFAL
jgi:hypothetical protein